MAVDARMIGTDVIGDMVAWGSHVCVFYETKGDLLEILTSYYKAGLEKGECCLWIVAEPLTVDEATAALKAAVPELDQYLADSRVEITTALDWFLPDGTFDGKRVTDQFNKKLAGTSIRGCSGLRVAGDTTWLPQKDWAVWCAYEDAINEAIGNLRFAGLCSYPLPKCGALEILDIVRTHQFALARLQGSWEVVETSGLKKAKADLVRLNEELEKRVEQRTGELIAASEALREAQSELARAVRLSTMGQLTASLAHEIKQPIGAAVTNAEACSRFLDREQPDLSEAREAALEMLKDARRAGEIIDRVSALYQKGAAQLEDVDVNEIIGEMLIMLRSQANRHFVVMCTDLTDGLPTAMADRVQLQQVFMNLMLNAIEAMKDGGGELRIKSGLGQGGELLISITDNGMGLPAGKADQVFNAFFTTKPQGTGLGLAITRSILESHGGSVWATPNTGQGTTFHVTLPIRTIISA